MTGWDERVQSLSASSRLMAKIKDLREQLDDHRCDTPAMEVCWCEDAQPALQKAERLYLKEMNDDES